MKVDPERLLIGVVAHTSREDMARKLAERTQAQVLNIDDGQARSQEDAFIACSANHMDVLRQLESLVTDQPWCIVLEDDALPIADFRIHAADALSHAPSPVIGFYINRAGAGLNRGVLRRALTFGTAWAVSNHLISAVAYAIHTQFLPEVIDRCARDSPETTMEGRFSNWAAENRASVYSEPRFYYTMPSLVDHSPGDSIIFPDSEESHSWIRRAWSLGVAANWDTPAVEYDPIT